MTQEDRIFELEKTLEIVLDLFDDSLDGKVSITVVQNDPGGSYEMDYELPMTAADSINAAIKVLYTDEEIDE